MKRNIATLLSLLVFFGYIYSNFKKQTPESDFDLDTFGKAPVIMNGRVQPLDSVAKNTLLAMNGKRSVVYQDGTKHTAIEWLAETLFDPSKAFDRPVFRIHDDGLRAVLPYKEPEKRESAVMAALLGSGSSHHYYSFNEIRGSFEKIRQDAMEASQIESEIRNRYQKAVINLANNAIQLYNLSRTIHHGETPSFLDELATMQSVIPAAVIEADKQQLGQEFDAEIMRGMLGFMQLYQGLKEQSAFFTHPAEPVDGEPHWETMSVVLDEITRTGEPGEISLAYATLTDAYRNGDATRFNATSAALLEHLSGEDSKATSRAKAEHQFNYLSPFYVSIVGYVMVLLLAVFSWPFASRGLNRAAFWTMIAVFVIHTAGMGYRIYIIGYAPVINLYSSAIYVGWGATFLCIIIERLFKNGIGSFIASVIGIASLIVAHHLIDGRDTLEQMKAVLDSNFWLTVHVLTITFGYASTFLSGFIGIFWVLFGLGTKLIDKKLSKTLTSIAIGIVCFSTLFSFFGTVSGGIWADQSWGRFWGWDPKENGAILLVLWNVIILHARWGGFAKTRGIMAMAIFGNVVTSWSWMGTNMLGIGLHSYGFMNSAFQYLAAFWISQLVIIILAYIPAKKWKSELTA